MLICGVGGNLFGCARVSVGVCTLFDFSLFSVVSWNALVREVLRSEVNNCSCQTNCFVEV